MKVAYEGSKSEVMSAMRRFLNDNDHGVTYIERITLTPVLVENLRKVRTFVNYDHNSMGRYLGITNSKSNARAFVHRYENRKNVKTIDKNKVCLAAKLVDVDVDSLINEPLTFQKNESKEVSIDSFPNRIPLNPILSENIRKARVFVNYDQGTMGLYLGLNHLGTAQQTVGYYESGKHIKTIPKERVLLIADLINVSITDMINVDLKFIKHI